MPDKPAARTTSDTIGCSMQTPTPGGPVPHAAGPGNPIMPPGSPTVKIGNMPAVTVGEKCLCISPAGPVIPNPIISGAMTVLINNKPAARQDDRAAHGGTIVSGHSQTLIGGPSCIGNPALGVDDCKKAAEGRPGGRNKQSFGNCGIEACRQLINRKNGSNISEATLKDRAVNNNWAQSRGGTTNNGRQAILRDQGIGASVKPQTMTNLVGALSQGRGVIASVWASKFWPRASVIASNMDPTTNAGGHAIRVTGIKLNDDGFPETVICSDSGRRGQCAYEIPVTQFVDSLRGDRGFDVTDDPL